jgi:hypothetical protein
MTDTDAQLDRLLAEINPVDTALLPLPVESLEAQALYARITGNPYAGRAPKRHRRAWIVPGIAAIVAFLGLGAGGAYAGFFSSHNVTRLAVLCYSGDNLRSTAVPVTQGSDGPLSACRDAWEIGHVGEGKTPDLLAACVNPEGVTAVFPSAVGANVCAQLGLPVSTAGVLSSRSTAGSTSAPQSGALPPGLQQAIISQLQSQCMGVKQAETSLSQLLTNAGVHWRVVVGGEFSSARPCASPGFDEPDRHLVITGIPRQPGQTGAG